MSALFELPQSELNSLHAIDPILDKDWARVLCTILSKLDADSQTLALQKILNPKGIIYNVSNGSYGIKPRVTLESYLQTTNIQNKQLHKAAQELLSIIPPPPTLRTMPFRLLMKLRAA